MAEYDYSSPGNFINGLLLAPAGLGAGSALSGIIMQTVGAVGMVDSAATSVGTITVPNVACSWAGLVLLRVGLTQAAHIYDSTRSWLGTLAVTRVPGAAAVGTLTIVTAGSVIATSSGGYTTTLTVALGTVGGAVGATNTFAINVTSTGSTASTAECQCLIAGFNGAAGGVTFA